MEREIRKYLDWKGTYATRASVNYKIWLDRFIEVCGNREIVKYSIEDIVKFKHWLETRYSSSSVQYAIIILKNFFSFYKEQGVMCIATSFIKIPPKIQRSHKAISENDYQQIISNITVDTFLGLRDSIIIRLLWETGVRVSELCDLNILQIDHTKNSTVIRSKKSYNQRIIVWSPETHLLLLKYKAQRNTLSHQKDSFSLFIGFLRGRGWTRRLTPRSIERIIQKHLKSSSIAQHLSPHSFRHGWATLRRDKQAPLSFIQKGLGHKSPLSTFIYEQYSDKEFETNANQYLKSTN
jgi:integrase/recombinase XerC